MVAQTDVPTTGQEPEGGAKEDTSALAGGYLTFSLAGESYGVGILKVRELINMQEITRVPETAEFTKGVINLRGQVIAVIDLRLRFGMTEADYTEETCIVIVESGGVSTGMIVDGVEEVVQLAAEEIEPPPHFGGGIDEGFIMAMGKANDRLLILLDSDRVVAIRPEA